MKIIKDTFQLKYFTQFPTLTQYGLSNYNRIINYKSGTILKTYKDNDIIYIY